MGCRLRCKFLWRLNVVKWDAVCLFLFGRCQSDDAMFWCFRRLVWVGPSPRQWGLILSTPLSTQRHRPLASAPAEWPELPAGEPPLPLMNGLTGNGNPGVPTTRYTYISTCTLFDDDLDFLESVTATYETLRVYEKQ